MFNLIALPFKLAYQLLSWNWAVSFTLGMAYTAIQYL